MAQSYVSEITCKVPSKAKVLNEPIFTLGQVFSTPNARSLLQVLKVDTDIFFQRHVRGDWGTVDARTQADNRKGLKNGFRVLSMYELSCGTVIVIVTEFYNDSLTVIMLQDEY
jgi:hypothetical protein